MLQILVRLRKGTGQRAKVKNSYYLESVVSHRKPDGGFCLS
jgi:hypothetical protein